MAKEANIRLFEEKKVRTVWDEDKEEWYFSVVDVIGILTDSINPTDYLKKLRKRDELLGEYIGTNCPHVEMKTETGKNRKTLAANTRDLFRIIQSIPSPKAEPFKLWLAQVAKERLDQLQDPELSIEQAMLDTQYACRTFYQKYFRSLKSRNFRRTRTSSSTRWRDSTKRPSGIRIENRKTGNFTVERKIGNGDR